jgi:cytochrome c oxidase assembly factor CtaG
MRTLKRLLCAAGLASISGEPAFAHGTAVPTGLPPWTLTPSVTLPLVIAMILFVAGWARLRARSHHGVAILHRRGVVFAAGWIVLAAAVVSPLHAAGERSFAAHMFEHELLMLAAAPLLVLSKPLAVMLWAFPRQGRLALGAIGRASPIAGAWDLLTHPVVATLVQAAALWLWHAPSLFGRALADDGWHIAQHLSFLLSALLFWSAMFDRRPRHYGVAALCLFVTSVVSGALGALMAFSPSPWYAGYAALGLAPMGLTPLEDQQLAGLLMWIPGGAVHAAASLAMVFTALKATASNGSIAGKAYVG